MTTDVSEDANTPSFSTYLNLANYAYNSGMSSASTGTDFVPLENGGNLVDQINYPDGFYGQAFIDKSTSQLVIAFEGTNLHSSPTSTTYKFPYFLKAQVADDADIFNGTNPTNAFADALAFTKNAISIAESEYNISAGNIFLDGHSLGGAEAEYVSSQLNLPGATFGAPGLSMKAGDTGARSGLIDYVDYGDPVGNYYTNSALGSIVQIGEYGPIQHYGTLRNTGVTGNDKYLKNAVSDYNSGNTIGAKLNLGLGFLHYHVLKNYAHDLIAPEKLYSDDKTTGADTAFFDALPQLVGATGPGECFVAGTRLMTPRGARAIEDVAPGDPVVTASGVATVIWVGRRRLDVSAHPRPTEILPVRIAAHALADSMPARDLYVSPGHGIAIDGALIPARLLVNGTTIAQVERARVDYWHIELERHDLVLAEGLATESYLDCGNRAAFEGEGSASILHPSFAAYAAHEGSCLPWIVAGPVLDAARIRLTARADEIGPAREGQPAGLYRCA